MQLIVLGMHRSGTSVVARLLNLMGAYLAPPELIMPPTADNPKGFCERWDVFGLHEDMLRDLGLAWDRPAGFAAKDLQAPAFVDKFRPRAEKILSDMDARRPWMLKDPRLNLLLPFWQPLLEVPVCVHVYRNPIQVAQSLQKRDGFGLHLGLALWEYYTLLGLAHSAELPRLSVSYQEMLDSPLETAQNLYARLTELDVQGLRLPSAREIRAFIQPGLHRQQGDQGLLEGHANAAQLRLHQAFSDNSVLQWETLPELSAGAAEILRAHAEQYRLAQAHQAALDTLKQTHQAALDTLKQTHQAALEAADERIARLRRRRASSLAALRLRRQAETGSRARAELYQARWYAAEGRIVELEQALATREENLPALEQELEHGRERSQALQETVDGLQYQISLERHAQERLLYWISALAHDIRAVFGSLTWRAGSAVTRLALALLLRKPEAGARGQIERIFQEIEEWRRSDPNAAQPSGLPALAGFGSAQPAGSRSLSGAEGSGVEGGGVACPERSRREGSGVEMEVGFGSAQPAGSRSLSGAEGSGVACPERSRKEGNAPGAGRYAGFNVLTLPNAQTYKKWYAKHRCPPAELEQQRREAQGWDNAPLISLAVPCYNSPPRWLDELLASIHRQTYPGWECLLIDDASPRTEHLAVIERWQSQDSRFRLLKQEHNQGVGGASQSGLEAALGDYFAIIDHDDLLEPNALFEVAKVIRGVQPDVIYSDEMLIRDNGAIIRCEFRPDFSYHFLLSHPYIVHLTVFRREALFQAGGYDPSLQVSQDYDVLLRVAAQTHDFHHIPKVLYQWRTHSGSTGHSLMAKVTQNSLAALNRHLRLAGLAEEDAQAVEGLSFNFFRIRHRIRPCTVSVIIPTRDRVELLKTCIASLLAKTRLPSGVKLEILVVDNGSEQAETLAYFADLEKRGHTIVDAAGPFNFSLLNNLAAKQAKGEFLLFLNNDIEIVDPGWLEAMLELMAWNDVGAVGAKLLYPDIGLIQHAGVIIGYNGIAAHDHQFYPEYEHGRLAPGHNHAMLVVRECLAVTAACLLARREAFDKVGGFDTDLQVGFGDTDLCLRLRQAGYRSLFTPYARLVHHESASRGYHDNHPVDTKLYQARWQALLAAGDPYYNPNLTLRGKMFEPRMDS